MSSIIDNFRTPDIHDKQRPFPNKRRSSPIIERNIKWLIEHIGKRNFMVGARVTITDNNLTHQREIIDYFYNMGIRYVWSDPLFPSVGKIPVCDDKEKLDNYHFDMDSYVKHYINTYRYANSIGIFYGSFLTCNFDGICNRHCRACTPVPHLTTDGYLSACDLVTFGNNAGHMDCFVYGKWNNNTKSYDLDYNKIKKLQNRTTDNMMHCRKCAVKEHCGGYCLGEVVNETGTLLGGKLKQNIQK